MRLPFTLTESSVLAVIPARYDSTRFPGKALANLDGHPMIEHVYRRASAAALVHGTIVATDDERIAQVVAGFGGAVVMTRRDHASGTDRIAEAVATVPCRLVVNVQGDEPLLEPSTIDAAVQPLLDDATLEMSTLCRPFADSHEFNSPHVVKVVCDNRDRALYFSRALIPGSSAHVGLYVYRRDVLLRLAALPRSTQEDAEKLEQLRALIHGINIRVVETRHASVAVDTPEDLERVRQLMMARLRSPSELASYGAVAPKLQGISRSVGGPL
jgi:3-deoxy-manno-octulosonate cytidylyltransferase (CMP-KDO synthetase)